MERGPFLLPFMRPAVLSTITAPDMGDSSLRTSSIMPLMNDEAEQEKRLLRVLARVREEYGFVPLVSEMMSARPDIYLPYSEISSSLFFKPKHMDRRTAELAAIAAGAALGSKHCLDVHILQAIKLGISEDAVLEATLIGAFMNMNHSSSIALRSLKNATGDTE